ncbi:MAG: hypothetical protein ACQESR_12755 [Planctomycetota bacterium]
MKHKITNRSTLAMARRWNLDIAQGDLEVVRTRHRIQIKSQMSESAMADMKQKSKAIEEEYSGVIGNENLYQDFARFHRAADGIRQSKLTIANLSAEGGDGGKSEPKHQGLSSVAEVKSTLRILKTVGKKVARLKKADEQAADTGANTTRHDSDCRPGKTDVETLLSTIQRAVEAPPARSFDIIRHYTRGNRS